MNIFRVYSCFVGAREVQERAVMMMMMIMMPYIYIYMVGRTGVIPYFTLSCFLRGFDGVSDTHLEKIIFMKKYLVYENRLLQISDFQEHFKR